ncbi:MAG: AmmeMemoRadiSam system radical SAM enzyme [Bacillota bacterium]
MKNKQKHQARFYSQESGERVVCHLCPHNCTIAEGKAGICGVRRNQGGELFTENYGQLTSAGFDPIEKKPLYHFHPASSILSLGTFGCNFSCGFCQNWRLSQGRPDTEYMSPDQVVQLARERKSPGIAYTYSEPSVWYEFVSDTARLAHRQGLDNVLVTNGYLEREPLLELLPWIDAANVDLKSFNDKFYTEQCGGSLEPVLHNLELMQRELHLELTTLIIPGYNDSQTELEQLFSWIADLDSAIPLHISRYFPNYKFDDPPTPLSTMREAYQLAGDYLDYVYLGNTNLDLGQDTFCPKCGKRVIKRNFYNTRNLLKEGDCPECGYHILDHY